MANGQHWALRVLRFITREEVKTPLSFLFKVITWLVAALIVILYAPIDEEMKWVVLLLVFLSLLGMATAVLFFAWFRPKNLVYGEGGHRAEHRVEFGTESKQIDRAELDALPAESDPKLPMLEQK